MQTQTLQHGFQQPNLQIQEIKEIQKMAIEDQREFALLQDMGLQGYEIQYLVHLKQKERLREKWKKSRI